MSLEVAEIGAELRQNNCVEIDWDVLGLTFDEVLAQEVIDHCPEDLKRPPQYDDIPREGRAVSPTCLAAARSFMEPLVQRLFVGDKYEEARSNWRLFGVNYYEQGDVFPRHQDFNNPSIATVVVASLVGVRGLIVGNKHLTLVPKSITIIDGGANPFHSAYCKVGPSVSIVADIPELLY